MPESLTRTAAAIFAAVLIVAAALALTQTRAVGTGDPAPCDEQTITVVDIEAWTETIPATPDLWWNWSPNKHQAPFDGPPAFPSDPRGTWQGPHENGGPQQGVYGTFQNGGGHGSWFHRQQGAAEQTIEHPAVTHEEPNPAYPCVDPTDPPTEPTDGPTEDPDPTTPTEPTDLPDLIPPTSDVPDEQTTEQKCAPAKCVRITRDGDGNVTDREVYLYPADAKEEGL